MLKQKTKLGRSVDIIIGIDGLPLGGQQGAILNRQAEIINITNKIKTDWAENLTGTKSWSIICNGLYVIDDNSFLLLEEAFINNQSVEITINLGERQLKGKALITDFPLTVMFNKEFKYNLKLLGTGPLGE